MFTAANDGGIDKVNCGLYTSWNTIYPKRKMLPFMITRMSLEDK